MDKESKRKSIFLECFPAFEKIYPKFDHLARLVEAKSHEFNITAIRDYDGIWVKHIIDSLYLLHLETIQELVYGQVIYDGITYKEGFVMESPNLSQDNAKSKKIRVIDIGTGAGFPGLPLAIACPWVDFTLVDGTNKKVQAVKEFVAELGLKNVEVVWGRAEELKKKPEYVENFDIVLARAVKYLPDLLKLLIPYAKMETGLIGVYKMISFEEEQAAIPIKNSYNLIQDESLSYYLPNSEKDVTPNQEKFHRKIIIYHKKPSVKARQDLY